MYQSLSKSRLPKNFRDKLGWDVRVWWIIRDALFCWSSQFTYGWRSILLKLFGAKIGRNVLIRPTVKITYPWKIKIGDYSWIGDEVILYSFGEIEIGKNVVISQRSYICTGSHDYTKVDFPIFAKKIVIEDEVWLATDVFVAPGVKVGRGTVVGARSSVFNDLPAGKVCIGSPAKPVKDRTLSDG